MEDVSNKIEKELIKASIFRIGEVFAVNGREITIKVDTNKNLSHLIYCGEIIKSVSVGSYVKIKKGFIQLVGKVESEQLKESKVDISYHNEADKLFRILIVKLIGYFDNRQYNKGIKELPLIGDTCYLMDNEEFSAIHRFAKENELTLNIGHLMADENVPIQVSINKLFASHIGIFGNTGSGKSHTLANIYKALFEKFNDQSHFRDNAKFVLFDFNGEYSGVNTITQKKTTYQISTRTQKDRLPLREEDMLKPELLYILCSASEKTQQPFISRALRLLNSVKDKENPRVYIRKMLRNLVSDTLIMSDRVKSKQILDYFEEILPHDYDGLGLPKPIQYDLIWHAKNNCYYIQCDNGVKYMNDPNNVKYIKETCIYKAAKSYEFPEDYLNGIIHFLYIQLIKDILSNRALNEHIAPVINKLKRFVHDFDKVFIFDNNIDFWNNNNLVVIDLNQANLAVKKLIPMFVSYRLYEEKKNREKNNSSLNIIVDEAHNVLSYESLRENESFKDFRLETFEEIIKEGRKFGVFLTISSQRPSDISPTIISQLHNYFIHRLVNNKDIDMIDKAVSYLDKVSLESLPILPVGACILSGLIADLPIVLQVEELPKDSQPKSQTIKLTDHWLDT